MLDRNKMLNKTHRLKLEFQSLIKLEGFKIVDSCFTERQLYIQRIT